MADWDMKVSKQGELGNARGMVGQPANYFSSKMEDPNSDSDMIRCKRPGFLKHLSTGTTVTSMAGLPSLRGAASLSSPLRRDISLQLS